MDRSQLHLAEKEESRPSAGLRQIKARYERPDGSAFYAFAVIGDASETALITGTAQGATALTTAWILSPGKCRPPWRKVTPCWPV